MRRALAVATALLLVMAACGDGAGDAQPVTPTGAATPSMPGGPGPRSIPATIVDLEIGGFPRPAAEACAGNTTIIDVAPGESIAATLESASPGTTIRVAAGTYEEQPEEWLALSIDTDDICIRSTGDAVIESADQVVGISVTGDDVVLEGIVLRGFEVGVAIDGRTGETQRNLTIERTRVEQPTGDFREGVVVYAEPSGSAPVLDGLLLLDVEVSGIDLGVSCNLGPCEHVWLERTSIIGRGGSGGSGADAFAIEEGRQIAVVDSLATTVAADGFDTKASDVVIFGSRVYDVERNGIKLWRGGDVINCIVDGSGADAALVGEEPGTYRYVHSLIAHHSPGDSGYVGTWSYDYRASGITVEIVNSIFYDNASGGFFVPPGAELSIRNTIFSAAADHKLIDLGDDTTWMFADLAAFEGAGFGSGNQIADPGFVDAAGHNYATSASSPARDAAEPISGLDVDAAGEARVSGGGADIGPIEG